jgi:hypothetical protein
MTNNHSAYNSRLYCDVNSALSFAALVAFTALILAICP